MKIIRLYALLIGIFILSISTSNAWMPSQVTTNAEGFLVVVPVDLKASIAAGRAQSEPAIVAGIRRFGQDLRDAVVVGGPEYYRQNIEAIPLISFCLLLSFVMACAYERNKYGRDWWRRSCPRKPSHTLVAG